jgi:predicted AAA+ superfamily ATPase
LENLVAIELFRKNKEFYYYSNSFECDFVTVDNFKVNNAIQVCYELNEGNKKREIKGLKKALDKFNLKEGLILTNSFENKIKLEDKTINIKPVWKWLLEEE